MLMKNQPTDTELNQAVKQTPVMNDADKQVKKPFKRGNSDINHKTISTMLPSPFKYFFSRAYVL